MEPDTIIFEDEDGNEFEFEVRDYFFYNGDEYALLTEVGQESDESGEECIICKVESVNRTHQYPQKGGFHTGDYDGDDQGGNLQYHK